MLNSDNNNNTTDNNNNMFINYYNSRQTADVVLTSTLQAKFSLESSKANKTLKSFHARIGPEK